MKKLKLFALALMLLLVAALPAAMADQVNVFENQKLVKSVVFKIGVPYYVVNGQTPGVKMDVAPFIQNDRTFVPVRFLGNALGVDDSNISWDNDTQTATLRGAKATLSMTIGKPEVVSDGQAKVIDVAPMLVDPGRTMLPARFVAEGLGYEVDWDEATQTVICWPQGEPEPDVSAVKQYLNDLNNLAKGERVNSVTGVTEAPNGGYVIPQGTKLRILVDRDGYYPKGQIDFQIDLKAGDIEQQYEDARFILLQTVDPETVEEAINYAKQASVRDDNNRLPPIKTFYSSNKMAVRIAGGDISITIQVWHTA